MDFMCSVLQAQGIEFPDAPMPCLVRKVSAQHFDMLPVLGGGIDRAPTLEADTAIAQSGHWHA